MVVSTIPKILIYRIKKSSLFARFIRFDDRVDDDNEAPHYCCYDNFRWLTALPQLSCEVFEVSVVGHCDNGCHIES